MSVMISKFTDQEDFENRRAVVFDSAEFTEPQKNIIKKKPATVTRHKKYLCDVEGCEKAFTRPCLLEQHKRSHSNERPFVCNIAGCNKAFFRSSHLKVHMFSHTEEKPLSCAHCGKGFNTQQHLKRHEKTHFDTVECTQQDCTAKFSRQSQLIKHIAEFHGLGKRFQCPHKDCGREFNHKSRMDMHIYKNHSSVPRYFCGHDNCEEKLFTWSALQKHIKASHKKIPCEECGKPCAGPMAVMQHAKEVHGSMDVDIGWQCLEPGCSYICDSSAKLSEHSQDLHGTVRPRNGASDIVLYTDNITNDHDDDKNSISRSSDSKSGNSSSIADYISGAAYEKERELSCPVKNCDHRSLRAYDLNRHIRTFHKEFARGALEDSANLFINSTLDDDASRVGMTASLHDSDYISDNESYEHAVNHKDVSIDPMILNTAAH